MLRTINCLIGFCIFAVSLVRFRQCAEKQNVCYTIYYGVLTILGIISVTVERLK